MDTHEGSTSAFGCGRCNLDKVQRCGFVHLLGNVDTDKNNLQLMTPINSLISPFWIMLATTLALLLVCYMMHLSLEKMGKLIY